MSRKRPLAEQVVVIGGGSYGLGRAIAVATARRGAKVVVGARTREALDGVLGEIEATGGEALVVEADISQRRVANLLRDGARGAREGEGGRRRVGHSPGRDQHTPVPPRAPEAGPATAARAADLPAGTVCRGGCALLRTAGARAPDRLGQKLLWGQKLSPRAGDLVLLRTGWKAQHTDELKPTDSPDNLFEPLPSDPGAHGRFDKRSRDATSWTWLRLHRGMFGAALALGTMGLLAGRSARFLP